MKTIAIIIPNITNKAGTERAVSNLANILSGQNYRVTIFSIASQEGNCPFFLNSNVIIQHLDLPYISKSLFFVFKHYFSILKKIKKEILKSNVELIVGTYTLINFLLTFLPENVKKLGCEHFNYEASGKIQNLLKHFFYKKLNAVVLLTERDKKNYLFCKNTFVIPNSLSFQPIRQSDCQSKIMVSLGRLTEQKGYDILIESISLIKDKLAGWKIVIYGDGEDRKELLKLIDTMGLSYIIEIHMPVSNVEEVYKNASIYLSSSRYEGLPMTLLEAQSCGLPCVVFDCPCGPAEIVEDGKTGFVVPLGNKEMFSQKILELVNNEELRKKFGKAAVEEACRFSTESVSKLWSNLLNSL